MIKEPSDSKNAAPHTRISWSKKLLASSFRAPVRQQCNSQHHTPQDQDLLKRSGLRKSSSSRNTNKKSENLWVTRFWRSSTSTDTERERNRNTRQRDSAQQIQHERTTSPAQDACSALATTSYTLYDPPYTRAQYFGANDRQFSDAATATSPYKSHESPTHESLLRIRHQRPLTQMRSILVLCRASSLTHACSIMAPFIGNMLTQQVPLLHICRMISLTRICSILAPTTGIQRVHPFPALQLLSQSNFLRNFFMEDKTQEVMVSGRGQTL